MKYFNKKNLLLSLTVIMGFLSMYNSAGPGAAGNGDRTGSPVAAIPGSNCSNNGSCHQVSPGSFTPVISIQLMSGVTPVTTYTPGNSYTLNITVSSSTGVNASTRYGFQTTALKVSNYSFTGAWGALPSGFHAQVINARQYIEHSSPQATNSVTIPWTAPGAGTGSVRFFASGNIVNGNGSQTGDNSINDSLTVTEFSPCTPPTVVATPTQITCHDANNGAISLAVSGGTTPYIFSWTGPAGFVSTSQNISSLASGLYTVQVTGGTCSTTKSIFINNPAAIFDSAASNGPICEGNTLNLLGFANGGTAPLSYSWSGPNGFTSTVLNPSIPLVPIADSGVYTLTVTDANGCGKVSTVHVTINPGLILTGNTTNPLCNTTNDGTVQLYVQGSATAPYTFSWTGPGSFTSSAQSLANLTGGIYTVTATPTVGCTQTFSATIVTPPAVTANAVVNNLPICAGSQLSLSGTGTGGTGTLSYHWSGPNGYFSNQQNPNVSNNVNFNASGNYTLAVTDGNNCTASSVVSVVVDTVPTVTATPAAVLCYGGSTGAVNLSVSGGYPFSYSWTGPNSYTASTQNISGVPTGTYTITVTGTGGCKTTKSATVNQPATPVTGSASSNAPICLNGTLNLFGAGTGGTGTISYSWTGPNGFTSNAANPVIASLTAAGTGVYTLTVKDINNCSYTTTTSVALSVAPVVTATASSATCFGLSTGSVTTSITGGLPPFSYSWTGPNGFTSNAANLVNVPAGLYSVSVNGACVGGTGTQAIVSQPSAITDTVYSNNPVCAGTLLNISSNVNGGTGTYTYSWTGPNNFISTQANPTINAVTIAGSGLYTLVVRDANNCIKTNQFTVVVDTLPVVHLRDTSVCAGSSLTLNAGNPGAAYQWNTGATTRTINVTNAGTYSVVVTNVYGCPSSSSANITANGLPYADSIKAVGIAGNGGGFNFSVVNPRYVTSYVWDFGDGSTLTSVAPAHYYAATGSYTVKLFAVNTCGTDTLTKKVVVTSVTGVQNVANGNSRIKVYPNPTRDFTIIENNGTLTLKNVKVINIMGAKVFEAQMYNQQSYRINTASFIPGVYTIYIETSEGTAVRKLEVLK